MCMTHLSRPREDMAPPPPSPPNYEALCSSSAPCELVGEKGVWGRRAWDGWPARSARRAVAFAGRERGGAATQRNSRPSRVDRI